MSLLCFLGLHNKVPDNKYTHSPSGIITKIVFGWHCTRCSKTIVEEEVNWNGERFVSAKQEAPTKKSCCGGCC